MQNSTCIKNSPERGLRSSPDLDPDLGWPWLSSHIVVNVSSTSNIIPSFIKIGRKKFLAKFEVTWLDNRRKLKNLAWVEYISVKNCATETTGPMGANNAKIYPFPLDARGPHLVHECLGLPHSPPQTARSVHTLLHNYATMSPLVTTGHPKFTLKTTLPLDDNHPHLTHPSLDWPHSPSQTASGSIHPFCHSTLFGQTDRQTYTHTQTDKWARQQVHNVAHATPALKSLS